MKQTAVEKLIKGQQEIISNFKLNVEQQEKLTQLFDECFELQKQQSLELIELTTQLKSVSTANWKIAEIECINIYNHYYNDIIILKEEPFKHKVEVLSKEEILANRSNAYDFIDFDKQETLEKLKRWKEEALIAHEINQKVIKKLMDEKSEQIDSEKKIDKILQKLEEIKIMINIR